MRSKIETMLAAHRPRPRASPAPRRPRTEVAVLSCMDARLDVYRILGLEEGDAHVLRNAGGTVTQDVILSLAASQFLLGTREILVVHHLDCAMLRVQDYELADTVERESGRRPPWKFDTCSDPVQRLEEAVRLLASDPYLPHTRVVRGVLYDEQSDTLTQICQADRAGGDRAVR